MDYQEIKNLHDKLDERMKNRDTEKDDKALAAMAETAGWEVFNRIAMDMIAEMLETPEFSEETPLDVRGALYEARSFGIVVLRKIIKNVESTRAAKKIEQIENKQPGGSELEA